MLPSNALDAIRCCDPIIFPNIFMLLKILSFLIKNRLNGLVLLSYYRNVVITPDKVLNEMAKKPRKIDLVL